MILAGILVLQKKAVCRAFHTGSRSSSPPSFGAVRPAASTFLPFFLFAGGGKSASINPDQCSTPRGVGGGGGDSTMKTRLFSTTATSSSVDKGDITQNDEPKEKSMYAELVQKLQSITHLERASAVLNYDQLVFMPQGDATSIERGAQMAALADIIHAKKTDKKLLELVEGSIQELKAEEDNTSDKNNYIYKARLLELERKSFVENERIPAKLASKAASLSASAYAAWVKARQANDFNAFAPVLEDCFQTAMDIATAKKRGSDTSDDEDKEDVDVYTQMLDEFEVDMAQSRIEEMFVEIQNALVPLLTKVLNSDHAPSTLPIQEKDKTFPLERQKVLSQRIVKAIGFNEELGRIDVSVHPFSTSFSPSDVRITSRFREDEWYQGLAGTIHEGGHAIYEQNLPHSSALSIDAALSMGTHESQSLFWERHVGLSRPFWNWATPLLHEAFDGYNYSAEQVYGAVNAVSQSLIRIEADELTYPLHVILRYNIEKDVVNGKLSVKDIPTLWNKDMQDLLQVNVPSDTKGCLQDVHWSGLAIGYFPTYLIGAVAAAQLAHYCRVDHPNMDDLMEQGKFGPIKQWLTQKVHAHGRRYKSLDALLEAQVGEALNPKYFIEYLTNKYTDLYQL
jgi:carboxypeptidase Taq